MWAHTSPVPLTLNHICFVFVIEHTLDFLSALLLVQTLHLTWVFFSGVVQLCVLWFLIHLALRLCLMRFGCLSAVPALSEPNECSLGFPGALTLACQERDEAATEVRVQNVENSDILP